MSEQDGTVEAQPEGKGYQFGEMASTQTEQATETDAPLTMETLEKIVGGLREEFIQIAEKEAQRASDKRFTKVQERVDEIKQLTEAAGIDLSRDQIRQIETKLVNSPENLGEVEPNGSQPGDPQALPSELDQLRSWAVVQLNIAGVPANAPEIDFPIDDPQFVEKVQAVASKYSNLPQSNNQPSAQALQAQMPTPNAAGAGSGDQLESLRQRLDGMHPTHPEYNKLHREMLELVKRRQ